MMWNVLFPQTGRVEGAGPGGLMQWHSHIIKDTQNSPFLLSHPQSPGLCCQTSLGQFQDCYSNSSHCTFTQIHLEPEERVSPLLSRAAAYLPSILSSDLLTEPWFVQGGAMPKAKMVTSPDTLAAGGGQMGPIQPRGICRSLQGGLHEIYCSCGLLRQTCLAFICCLSHTPSPICPTWNPSKMSGSTAAILWASEMEACARDSRAGGGRSLGPWWKALWSQ